MKKTYIVNVREVWVQPVEIEAETVEEALEKVEEGDGIEISSGLEYSHTLEEDFWTTEEKKKKENI